MGEALIPYFENVTPLIVAQSGHFVPEEQPVVLAEALQSFLKGHDEHSGKMGHDDRGAGCRRQGLPLSSGMAVCAKSGLMQRSKDAATTGANAHVNSW